MFGVIVYTERLVLSKRFLFFDVKPFAVTFFRALAETALLVFQHWLSCRQKKQMCCLCGWFFNEAQLLMCTSFPIISNSILRICAGLVVFICVSFLCNLIKSIQWSFYVFNFFHAFF